METRGKKISQTNERTERKRKRSSGEKNGERVEEACESKRLRRGESVEKTTKKKTGREDMNKIKNKTKEKVEEMRRRSVEEILKENTAPNDTEEEEDDVKFGEEEILDYEEENDEKYFQTIGEEDLEIEDKYKKAWSRHTSDSNEETTSEAINKKDDTERLEEEKTGIDIGKSDLSESREDRLPISKEGKTKNHSAIKIIHNGVTNIVKTRNYATNKDGRDEIRKGGYIDVGKQERRRDGISRGEDENTDEIQKEYIAKGVRRTVKTVRSEIAMKKNGGRRYSSGDIITGKETRVNNEDGSDELNHLIVQINSLKQRLKEALDENLDLKNLNKSMKIQLLELNNQAMDLKIENCSLKSSGNEREMKTPVKNSKPLRYDRDKRGRRVYSSSVEEKYRSVLEKVKERVRRFTVLEVVEADDFDNEKMEHGKGPVVYYNWEGRLDNSDEGSKDMEGVLDDNGVVIVEGTAQCPMNAVLKWGMYTPSTKTVSERLNSIVLTILDSDTGKAIREAKQVDNCVEQICSDRAIISDYKARLANALGVRKKACRNRFTNLLGYTMLGTKIGKAQKLSEGERRELEKQQKEFEEKIKVHTERPDKDIDFSWWRTKNAKQLCYSDMASEYVDSGMNLDDKLFCNQVGRSIYEEYIGRKMDVDKGDQATIASLARVDVWIFLVAKFCTDDREKGKSIQMRYSEAQSIYLPLALGQILTRIRIAVEEEEENELTVRMSCGMIDGDLFNNQLRRVTEIVDMKKLCRKYVKVRPRWFIENISEALGYVLDCYVGMFKDDCAETGRDDERSQEITLKTINWDGQEEKS